MLRVIDAITSTRNAVLAPVALGVAVMAGLVTGNPEVFQAALAVGGLAWLLSVLGMASKPRPGEPEDVSGGRGRILREVDEGLQQAEARLMGRAEDVARHGRTFRRSHELGDDREEGGQRCQQLARLY